MNEFQSSPAISPFERIRRTNPAGNQFWSSRDFAWLHQLTDHLRSRLGD